MERGASGFLAGINSHDLLSAVVALQVLLSTLRGAPLKKIALVAVARLKGWEPENLLWLRMAILVIPNIFFCTKAKPVRLGEVQMVMIMI